MVGQETLEVLFNYVQKQIKMIMDLEKEFENPYDTNEIYNMVYNLMLLDHLRDVHIGYMEDMKRHFSEKEEYEKCENVKQFINRLIKDGNRIKPN